MLNYDKFYRDVGIRKIGDVKNPPVIPFNELELPKNSSLHFVQFDPEEGFEISEKHFLLSNIRKKMYCTIVEDYQHDDIQGQYHIKKVNPQATINAYFRANRRIKNSFEEIITDPFTMHVFSYGLLNKYYTYFKARKSNELMRWLNHMRTVFTVASNYALEDNRNHFIVLDVPRVIPSLNKLAKREDAEYNKQLLRYFRTEDEWMMLALWKLFHQIDVFIFLGLKPETYKNINIVWKSGTVATVINLQKWLDFDNLYNTNSTYSPFQFSKYVLNSFLILNESYQTVESSVEEDFNEVEDTDDEIDEIPSNPATKTLNDLLGDFGDTSPTKYLDESTVTDDKAHHERVVKGIADEAIEVSESPDEVEENEINERLAALEYTNTEDKEEEEVDSDDLAYTDYVPKNNDVLKADENAVAIATNAARNGVITAGELRHARKLATRFKSLKNPYNPKESFVEALSINEEDLKLSSDDIVVSEESKKFIPDESMYSSSLKKFDEKYVKELMPKHIVQSVMSLSKVGITVQDYDIETVSNINDDFEIHTVKVATVNGKTSTVRFRIPTVNEYGEFRLGGIKYRLRKQWSDMPIRKISDTEVALTSYYSKLFVRRTPRAAFNYERWFKNKVTEFGIDSDNIAITNLRLNNVFDPSVSVPREYSMVAKSISSFDTPEYSLFFDYNNLETNFKNLKEVEKGFIPVGYKKDNPDSLVLMNKETGLIKQNGSDITLLELIGLAGDKVPPHDYAEISIFGKPIPLVYLLAYQVGFGNLLKTTNTQFERLTQVPKEMLNTHLIIRFKDEVIAIPNSDKKGCLLFSGMNRFKNDIKSKSIYSFDDKEVYSIVFENNRVDLRFLKECATLFPMWVDHITHGILLEMGEPTDLVELLIRACELLLTDEHLPQMDSTQMRIRGYERFSGMVYSELAREVRSFNFKPNRKDKTYSINPDAVWYAIRTDNSVTQVQECNPIHSLKEQEALVFTGEGGRSNVTMTAESRKFNKSDMGIVSEATVDSQLTGVVTFLSASPRFNSMYGTVTPVDPSKELPAASLVSTSMLLLPGADIDDPKRTNFASVQNSQTMPAKGYQLQPVRTGYERVVGQRTSNSFCQTAQQDGVVTDKDNKNETITITYADETQEKISTQDIYAPWAGKLVAQPKVTDFNKGDKVKAGDVLVYNPTFFKKDKLLPNQVSLTTQLLARVAIIEGGDVYEDSCAISKELSERLGSELAHVRNIVLDEGQDIANLVEIGDEVEPDSILCTIVNSQTDNSFYDEQTLSLLEKIASTSPKAKDKGVITKIEVLYTGEIDDMPTNVQAAALASDKALWSRARKLGTEIKDGRVDIGHRIDGNGLGLNQVVIKVYLVSPLGMSTGDKVVVAHQLKGTVARVWNDANRDSKGEPIDAYFSGQSIDNRIVDSPYLVGTTSTIMLKITENVIDHYFN